MKFEEIHENLTHIKSYELLGKLPDPFLFNDGTRVSKTEDWAKRREEIYETAINLQFGTQPPAPEFLEVDPLYIPGKGAPNMYRIRTGTRQNPVVFTMTVFKACSSVTAPVVISGDLCFGNIYDKEFIHTFTDNDIHFVLFNRTEIAPDVAGYNLKGLGSSETGEYELGRKVLDQLETKNCGGQLKEAYPEYTFGTVGAWAWGYSRCVDALEILGIADMNLITFTGLSRGGKACALAGALDERALIVNPSATCSGAYSSYRINIEADEPDGHFRMSEPLSNIFHHFPSWMGTEMEQYIGHEEDLPFDSHFLKAMIAPRILFVSEAANDIMANPVGSWQTTEAAAEVFKFLDCEENLYWYYRRGTHGQNIEDITQLVNIVMHVRNGEPLNDRFFKLPFPKMAPAYDWKCPEKE